MAMSIKVTINELLAVLGYQITRIGTHAPTNNGDTQIILEQYNRVLENFKNLSRSYELVQKELDNSFLVAENEMRPKLLARLLGTPPSEAYYVINALAKTSSLEGDVCEFGVAQGETSALIANEIVMLNNKTLHLFDSFEGLPKPTEKDKLKEDIFSLGNMNAYFGTMSYPEAMVRTRLDAISFPTNRYLIHKGFIENLLNEDMMLPNQVSFAYVDFDFYEPIKLTLNFLHNVTPSGAIVIVDDYNFFSTGAKTAVDEFVNEQNLKEKHYECFIPDSKYGFFAVLHKLASEGKRRIIAK